MHRRALCVALFAAACTGDQEPDPKSGTEPPLLQTGTAFRADMARFADGNVPWVGASNVAVREGAITLAPTAGSGQFVLPYSMRPSGAAGQGFDSTITVEAEVPNGAQLIVGRGRLRDSINQSGVGVIVAPSTSAVNPTSFLVGLGLGSFGSEPLACAGTPFGQSTLLIPTIAGTSAVTGITSMDLGRQTIALPSAPQLAVLANELPGGQSKAKIEATRSTFTFAFKKTGNGTGTVAASQGDREIMPPASLDAATMTGRSFACKLSWVLCEAICESALNATFVFGKACAPNACRNGTVDQDETTIDPEPGDFSGSETCRQSSACNATPAPSSAVTLTAKSAIREVFRDDASSNQVLFQLVRNGRGEAPRVFRIQVDR